MKISNSPMTLREGDLHETEGHPLWFVQADGVVGVDIHFGPSNMADGFCRLEQGDNGLIVSFAAHFRILSGQVTVYPLLNVQALCKLQAFLDTALDLMESEGAVDGDTHFFWEFFSQFHGESMTLQKIKNWMIRQAVTKSNKMKNIATVLRRMECYWLTRFLIQQSDGAERVQDLGARYGVSISHFRRLSSHALGKTVKVELRAWRLSRALLDLIGSDISLTDVAMRHGYASLSHFSTDVRQLCGISPRRLKNFNISEL